MTAPLKAMTITFEPVALEKLIVDGNLIFPELTTKAVHIDASLRQFLSQLLQQYALEKLQSQPTSTSVEDMREYLDHMLTLGTQVELIAYLLEVDSFNRKLAQAPTPTN